MMATKVCSKCGVASEEAKPLKCSKCGSRDFHDSLGSAFGKKASTPEAAPAAAAPAPPKPPEFETLFDKYGGIPTIAKVVKAFHQEIMARHHLAGYFEGIDMEHLAQHTVKYVAFVMGKPAEFYTGRDMYTAHAKFHISGMHFDEVADVLKDVLTAAGMSKPDIALVMLRVESLREMIIA
jgi:hemoglobin